MSVEEKKFCPNTNLVWAILCTVLCCLPLGVVAIVKASSVEKLWAQERYEEAQKAADDAKKYSIWGAVLAAIGILLYVIIFVGAACVGMM